MTRTVVDTLRGIVAKAPIPYVSRSGGDGLHLGSVSRGDTTAQLEASGGNSTLWSIVNKLSTSVAALDWHMHQASTGSTCEVCGEGSPPNVRHVENHAALVVWNRPNDFYTSDELVETGQQHMELVGELWWVVVKLAGRPVELWPVRPDRMAPVRDPDKFTSGYVYRTPDSKFVPLALDEVIFMRVPSPIDPYRGQGAVQTLLTNLYGARAAAEWNARFFENNAIPGGIVEIPTHLQDREFDEFNDRWIESHRGVGNAHTVAMLEHGAKWVNVKYTHTDMGFVDLRKVTREEMREAFTVHGHILGLSDDINRANAEAADVSFARRLIVPRAERLKATLNTRFLKLFRDGKGYSFAYANPVPEDVELGNQTRESRAKTYKTLIDAGMAHEAAAQVAGLPAGLAYTGVPATRRPDREEVAV